MFRLTEKNQIKAYLTDASQFSGEAEGVVLAESEKEISDFLKEANARKIPVTVSGGRTGLVGGAVPLGGWVLSTEKLCRILEVKKDPRGIYPAPQEAMGVNPAPPRRGGVKPWCGVYSWARVEPGIFLKDLDRVLEKESLFYPPDPTGPKAFLGGTVATNASGPNSFKYGPTRGFIQRLRLVLADGEILDLSRGQFFANREGILEIPLRERRLKIPVPHYRMPPVKHAAGYFATPSMDAIDLVIGSEGTLGVVTQIELKLLPRPSELLAFIAFFRSEEASWHFAKWVRERSLRNREAKNKTALDARVLEYFDSGSLEFLRPQFPSIPKEARSALFIEQEVSPKTKEVISREWSEVFDGEEALEEIWQGDSFQKQEEFRRFRSELPLAVKDFLAQHKQRKIGTDTCVPPVHFEELMRFHRQQAEATGLPNVTFGHIGEGHVHLNLLPRSEEEARRGQALYPVLVEKAEALGGTFSAEHGVGKLKRPFLARRYGAKGIQEMRRVKQTFDPHGILGQGNLFEIRRTPRNDGVRNPIP